MMQGIAGRCVPHLVFRVFPMMDLLGCVSFADGLRSDLGPERSYLGEVGRLCLYKGFIKFGTI